MKIVLRNSQHRKRHTERIAALLSKHTPHNTYHTQPTQKGDLWHFINSSLPLDILRYGSRSVVSLPNLHFVDYPHIYTPLERYVIHPILREGYKRAARIVTHNRGNHQRIIELLGVDPERVLHTPSLIVLESQTLSDESAIPTNEELLRIRQKYELPQSFILSLGEADAEYGQAELVRTILESDIPVDVVICGRHTAYANEILEYAREMNCATRIHFLYEASLFEVHALYHLALGVVYTSPEDAPIEPVIEGLRRGAVMVLSDTPRNRECAQGAAIYVSEMTNDKIEEALRSLLYDQSVRGQLTAQSAIEAQRYSEKHAAEELAQIYEEAAQS